MAEKQRIAVFDFDGTLTTNDTFVQFAIFARGWWRTMSVFLFYSPLIVLMKLRICNNGWLKQHIFSTLFKGMSAEQFKKLGSDFSIQIDSFINTNTFDRLHQHQCDGESVVVATASIDEWVRPWCESNNIQLVVATQVEVKNDILTGRFSTPNCYGHEKVSRLKDILGDLSHYHITAYGDSRGDREMMAIADSIPLSNRKS